MKTIVTIPRRAIPKGSTHAFKHRITGKIITKQNNADSLYEYQDFIAYSCRKAGVKVSDGPVKIEAKYMFQRPLSHFKAGDRAKGLKPSAPIHYLQTPDKDKLDRAVFDALHGVAYNDDKQVTESTSSKWWTTDGDVVFLEITN